MSTSYPIAGTTRDSVDTHFNAFGKDIILVDTAGLRRKAKVKENIEFTLPYGLPSHRKLRYSPLAH